MLPTHGFSISGIVKEPFSAGDEIQELCRNRTCAAARPSGVQFMSFRHSHPLHPVHRCQFSPLTIQTSVRIIDAHISTFVCRPRVITHNLYSYALCGYPTENSKLVTGNSNPCALQTHYNRKSASTQTTAT